MWKERARTRGSGREEGPGLSVVAKQVPLLLHSLNHGVWLSCGMAMTIGPASQVFLQVTHNALSPPPYVSPCRINTKVSTNISSCQENCTTNGCRPFWTGTWTFDSGPTFLSVLLVMMKCLLRSRGFHNLRPLEHSASCTTVQDRASSRSLVILSRSLVMGIFLITSLPITRGRGRRRAFNRDFPNTALSSIKINILSHKRRPHLAAKFGSFRKCLAQGLYGCKILWIDCSFSTLVRSRRRVAQ